MLGIRLKRTGRTNDPSFKIVVGERKYSPKSGKHFEYLGSYNPKTKATIIDAEKVKEWLAKGAQASDTVHNLLIAKGIITGKKINVLPAFKAPAPTPGVGAPTANVGEETKKEEPKAAAPTETEAAS